MVDNNPDPNKPPAQPEIPPGQPGYDPNNPAQPGLPPDNSQPSQPPPTQPGTPQPGTPPGTPQPAAAPGTPQPAAPPGTQPGTPTSEDLLKDMMRKYKQRLSGDLQGKKEPELTPEEAQDVTTREYREFKQEYMPKRMGWYERACQKSEKFLKLTPKEKEKAELIESLSICHLNTTPEGVKSFAVLGPLLLVLIGCLVSFVLLQSTFFIIFFMAVGFVLYAIFNKLPHTLANKWRLKSSNQMVLCIFYVVTYMRHTSNLERAVEFASEHLSPPLSLDLKRVLWNLETEEYSSIKESLDAYLDTWKKWNNEFIESFHLIESSLFESSEERRITLLDKSLDVILQETFEKMLHYSQDLKGPLSMLHMMGIILPIMGLVILPLVVSFMCAVKWYHLSAIYNIALPLGVFYLGKSILSRRPTGYGASDVSESGAKAEKLDKIIIPLGSQKITFDPLWFSITIAAIFVFIGLLPLTLHIVAPQKDFILTNSGSPPTKPITTYDDPDAKFYLLGYKESRGCGPTKTGEGDIIGPFGFGSSLISLALPFGVAFAIGFYYKTKTKNFLKMRDEVKKLEKEFASALFQLGNRLGDGLPAEIAFAKVATTMEGTPSADFFKLVASNIIRLGLSVEQAIFDPHHGALKSYPSNLIESSMKVLTQSAKKGPMIAAQALINVSRYVKEIHRVNERLKDLMADVISSMKSQISFMTPVISGIVIGITAMITTILGKISTQMSKLAATQKGGGGMLAMFSDGVPTFYFQLIVGFYVVELIYVLTILSNGIENGDDKLNEKYMLGVNMAKSALTYTFVALVVMLLFNIIAGSIMSGINLAK
ncbi:hypothetical protein ACFL0W_02990 [Nanoarchaeota archaeon]